MSQFEFLELFGFCFFFTCCNLRVLEVCDLCRNLVLIFAFIFSPYSLTTLLPFSCQSKEDAYFVVLSKEEGAGLGFSVAGGIDLEQKSVTVSDDASHLFAKLVLKHAGD